MTSRVIAMLVCMGFAGTVAGGCSSVQGPLFKPVPEIPEGNCLLYVYRPDDRMPTIFTVAVNGAPIGTLERGTYVPLYLHPGRIVCTSIVRFKFGVTGIIDPGIAGETTCMITAEAGRTYYIEGVAEEGNAQRLKLLPGSERYGQIRIRECHLLPPEEIEDEARQESRDVE